MRTVVDTNILIRALLKPEGTVAPLLARLRTKDYTILYSSELLEEIEVVLSRPRFRLRYGIREEEIRALLELIILLGEKVTPVERIDACRDPKDNKLLEAAVEGGAEAIVTGDDDLFVLHPFRGISMLSPSAFLKRLDKDG